VSAVTEHRSRFPENRFTAFSLGQSQEWFGLHGKAKTWFGLLLVLHVLVHPVVHAARPLATASGPPALSAGVAGTDSHTHDCQVCRTANRFVPIIGFAVPEVCNSSSPVVTDPISEFFGLVQFEFRSRAPPVS